jgi:hypothetical protein
LLERAALVALQRYANRPEGSHQHKSEYQHQWQATHYTHCKKVIGNVGVLIVCPNPARHPVASVVGAK